MKSESSKPKKNRRPTGPKIEHPCGTLSYLAECRGVTKKTEVPRWTEPPDSINKIVRKYPAGS